jgi:hypothetical protein
VTEEEHRGVVASLTSLGRTALTTVPPAFLLLAILNVAFLFAMGWVMLSQNASRERVLAQIITSCLQQRTN